ncbi:TraR/DksA family transcriptional regulator [Rhodococcus sp. TAF43]|uniref:TraR/DksA family transcriptional regulator n=1 Tax=unclassified Rhodococcus (in: high G+C Gram-positive bacteria) TaxID=192944 RepID=UPI0015828D46|nr:TraR/DksA C4-type zinc finger protein [Rhodococcus sp. W8901]QKT09804.1 TraR/DksA C4-type zinc finger protein [Rhodococcus sp. W8901]
MVDDTPAGADADATASRHRARIARERADTERRIAALNQRFTGIVEGSEFTTDDDEHDPEGSTIAFERAQVSALLDDARRDLEDLAAATQRLENGTYGVCVRCGTPITEARLDAVPAATMCIDCSARRH